MNEIRSVGGRGSHIGSSMAKTVSVSALPLPMSGKYVLSHMARHWRAAGIDVEIAAAFHEHADVCILHHDRTRIDRDKLPPAPASARVLNGEALDISKRLYTQLEVSPSDDWDAPVIIKTDLNNFGSAERRLGRPSIFDSMRKRLSRYSWRMARRLPPREYPVLDSIRDVPDWVWADRGYLVEKFLPERHEGLFSIRGWLFFGSRSYGYRLFATDPMVKTGTMVRHEFITEIPDELRQMRARLKLDFGKFDYVVHDGRAIVLDANKTAALAGEGNSPRLKMLAEGIGDFL
jgi:hypothetical protein